ncbi:MAG: diguanylate cyclase [Thermocrinis sp.]|nr:diguanylate cyclase [Thermocrinis sp.]
MRLCNRRKVNYNYGYHVENPVLAKVAKVLRTSMRAKDIVGRWGGDEFVVVMPNKGLENAKKVVESIKFQLGKMEIRRCQLLALIDWADTLRDMKAIQVIEEILSKAFKRHRFPVSLKAEAVLLYFKGLSLRAVREFLLHKGY